MFFFGFLIDLCFAYFVKGMCTDNDFYRNISHSQELIKEIREKEMDSSRILIEYINLSGYVLKDVVSLSSFNSYKKHNPFLSEHSNNSRGHKHHIISVMSRDNIGVISIGVFYNKTTPLWQNEEKHKALRYYK